MKLALAFTALAGLASVGAGELLVEQVPASTLSGTNWWPVTAITTGTTAIAFAPAAPDRWEKFEAEFGIQQPSQSLVKGSLQTAKYQLDRTALTLQEFLDTVTDRLRFDYGLSDLGGRPQARRSTRSFWLDSLSNARLQSDINLKLTEKAFVGVKLVLPLGD